MKVWTLIDEDAHFHVIDMSTPEQRQKVFKQILKSMLSDDKPYRPPFLTKEGEDIARQLVGAEQIDEDWFRYFLSTYTDLYFTRGRMEEVTVKSDWDDRLPIAF